VVASVISVYDSSSKIVSLCVLLVVASIIHLLLLSVTMIVLMLDTRVKYQDLVSAHPDCFGRSDE